MQQPLDHQTKCDQPGSRCTSHTAVILAGRLRESALRESINVHVLCLPVGHSGTLLDAWLDALRSVPNLADVRVVVNNAEEAAAVTSALPRQYRTSDARPRVEVIPEAASWRGAGGIVRDATEGVPDDVVVLVCEGKRLPPPTLEPLLLAMNGNPARDAEASGVGVTEPTCGQGVAGVVGVCGEDEPAGVYAFRRRVIRSSPRVGYVDLKEQFLPSLAKAGERVVAAHVCDDVPHLRDLGSYLETVRHSLNNGHGGAGEKSPLRVSARASVSGSAVLDGFCIIEPGAVIEDGAVVHDSVVLWGATIGGGAVVSRSVVGPLTSVEPRARVVGAVAARETMASTFERAAREPERRWG
jgi:hypothetical protein